MFSVVSCSCTWPIVSLYQAIAHRLRNLYWFIIDSNRRDFFCAGAYHFSAKRNPVEFEQGISKAENYLKEKFSPDSEALKYWQEWKKTKVRDHRFVSNLTQTCLGNCTTLALKILERRSRVEEDDFRSEDFKSLDKEFVFACVLLQHWYVDLHNSLLKKMWDNPSAAPDFLRENKKIIKELYGIDCSNPQDGSEDIFKSQIHFIPYLGLIDGMQINKMKNEPSLGNGLVTLNKSFRELFRDEVNSDKDFLGCVILSATSQKAGIGHAMMLYIDDANGIYMLYDNNRGFYKFYALSEAFNEAEKRYKTLYHCGEAKEILIAGSAKPSPAVAYPATLFQ